MHERQAIRQQVIAMLTGTAPRFATAARDRVCSTRQEPERTAELPAINVYTDGEEVTSDSVQTAPRELTRQVTIAIEAWAAATATRVEDQLDDLALEIETAMDSSVDLNGAAFMSILQSTAIGFKLDGARPMGCIHLEFLVTYHTGMRLEAPTDDFLRADVMQTDPAAHDSFNVRSP